MIGVNDISLFFSFNVSLSGENLTQDDQDIFRYEAVASFPPTARSIGVGIISTVSRYSPWDGSEKLQLTRICINLCGRHGCSAQSGNAWLPTRKEDKVREPRKGLKHHTHFD